MGFRNVKDGVYGQQLQHSVKAVVVKWIPSHEVRRYRVKQPCHANVGLCDGGHLWQWFIVFISFSTLYPTANDYSLIPMIIAGADEIVQGKYPDTVVYRRSLEKEYYYVECTRMGRKRLAMKTFYKTKIGG